MTFNVTFAQTLESPNVDIKIEKSSEVSIDVKKDNSEKESKEEVKDTFKEEVKDEEIKDDTKEDVKEDIKYENDGEVAGAENTNTVPESSLQEEAVVQGVIEVINSCDVEQNLISNGGFEYPVVTSPNGWDIYDDETPGLDWTVEWRSDTPEPLPAVAKLELHKGVNGWTSDEGSQHAELDTDFGTPAGGQASVKIYQDITTIPGKTYTVSYAFSPRPGTSEGENYLKIFVDGVHADTRSTGAYPAGNTDWTTYTFNFVATGSTTNVAFQDAGYPNAVGTFLDDVKVNCTDSNVPTEPTGPSCDSNEIWARIFITDFQNVGVGDMSDNIYVGNNSSPINSGDWFMVHDGTNYINDPTLYEDVPGLAVQRLNGKVLLGIHGSHPGTQASIQEFADGYIEFFNGNITSIASDSGKNKIESGGIHPDVVSFENDKSNFNLGVNTADDFYFVNYTYQTDESCTPPPTGPSCDSTQIWARVNIDSFSNEGAGNFTNNVYLGSSSNVINQGEWFMITDNNGNYISDPVITGYQNVTGLAIRRVGDGRVVLVLQGSNSTTADLEQVKGNIEFFNANVTNIAQDISGVDPLETDVNKYTYIDSISFAGDKSFFDLHVSTGNDKYVTTFIYAEDEICGDPEPTTSTVNVCKLNEQGAHLSGWDLSLFATDSVEQVNVYPDGATHASSSYPAGAYKLEANGQYVYRPDQPAGSTADAAYSLRIASDEATLGLNPSYFYGATLQYQSNNPPHQLGIRVNGNGPVWGNTYNPSHKYFYQTSNVSNAPFNFSISDSNYTDNSGFLTVDIYPGYTGTTGEDGCVTFEDVPFGTYDFSEVMKEGWTLVSGGGEVVVDETEEMFEIVNTINQNPVCDLDCNEEGECTSDCIPTEPTCEELQNCENPNNPPTDTPTTVATRTRGGSSSSGSLASGGGAVLGASTEGDVLGACVPFTEYHRKGDVGGEVSKIQEFLNQEMNAGIIVDGVYGESTVKGVHAFQKKYFEQIISPWVPSFLARTTGKFYKTTRMMVNKIIDCPEAPVFLEDPKIMYEVKWDGNKTE